MANKPHSQSCCAIGFAGVPDVSGSVPLKNSPECFVDNVDLTVAVWSAILGIANRTQGDVPMTEEFNELIRQLGETVYQKVQAEMADREWVRACLDVRYSPAGDSWLTKTRAVAPNGTCVSIKMCNEIDIILISLNSHRKLFQDEWYGL